MNNHHAYAFQTGLGRRGEIPFAMSRKQKLAACVTAAVLSVSIMAVEDTEAAEVKKKVKGKPQSSKLVNGLQEENALLRERLEALERERDALKRGAVATSPATNESTAGEAANTPAESVAETEKVKPESEKIVNLGEVVVNAKPKLEKLHDVKQSVSVVSGKELSRELALDLGAITRRTANVQFNQNNTRGASLSIRGLGKRSFSETQDPSVGVTVDGISYGLSQLANFSFYDIESVEATRGPRGTEGGLSASAGKVNVYSKLPTFTPTAELSLTYGQREALILQGALGGAVIKDLLAWRGSFIVDKGRGYYNNTYDNNYSFYNRDRLSGRVQFLFTPTDNLKALIRADFEPNQPQLQNGLTFYHAQPLRFANGTLTDPNGTSAQAKLDGFTNAAGVYTGPRAYFQGRGFSWKEYSSGEQRHAPWFNENQGQTVSSRGGSLAVDWDKANHVFSSITGVRYYNFDAHNDEGTPYDISLEGGGGVRYDQYTQEFKIANKPNGGFIDYKAGVFGILTSNNVQSKTGWGSDAGAWFATDAQYKVLDTNAGENRGSGLALLKDSLVDVRKFGITRIRTASGAAYGETDLHFTDKLTLTTGLRVTHEHRTTEDQINLTANGAGGGLNPVAINRLNLGGFASNAQGVLGTNNSTDQLALADAIANRYYGKAKTSVAGDAYNSLTPAQKAQVAAAKAVRNQQIGLLYNPVKTTYNDVLYTAQVTPSYKINDDLTTYISWQYGEKSGSALNVNGISSTVKPEVTNALELGFKTFWLNKALIFNFDAFLMDIKNYQQTVQVFDQYTTNINIGNNQANPTAYTSAQDNVAHVRVYGVEFDSVFNVNSNLSLRFNGAYNNAKYLEYTNAAKPEELAYLPGAYLDFSGQTLPGASKWSFVVGAEYTRPVFDTYRFHTSFNTNFQSGYNNLDNLSSYGWLNARSQTDAAIGISTKNNLWDVSVITKNLFSNDAHEEGWNSYAPNPYPLWVGVQITGKI